jgi:hypothetical protein
MLEEANQRMARALGVRSTSTDDGPNSQPLPNPWAPQRTSPSTTPASGLPRSPFNFPMGGFPAFPTAPPNAPLQPQATSTGQSPNMTFFPPLFPFAAPPGNASGAPNGMPPFMMPMVPNSNPNQPMPNNPFMMMQQLMQSGQMNPTPTPTPPTEPVEIRYREQLQCLRDMGFTNEDLNKRAILAAVALINIGW